MIDNAVVMFVGMVKPFGVAVRNVSVVGKRFQYDAEVDLAAYLSLIDMPEIDDFISNVKADFVPASNGHRGHFCFTGKHKMKNILERHLNNTLANIESIVCAAM